MGRRYSFICEGESARRIEALAREYDLTTQEVLQQLVAVGLEEIEPEE